MTAPSARGSLWRHRDFLLLWGGQTISEVGSTITVLAIPLVAVTVLHASSFEVGILNAFNTIPFLLFSLPAGVIIDRIVRHRLMMWTDMVRGLLLASIPLMSMAGWLSIPSLCAVVVLVGTCTVLFDVAYLSYLPSLVAKEQLVDGNGKLGTTQGFAYVVGPTLGGSLVGAIGAVRTMWLDAGSFVLSALSLRLIRTKEVPVQREPATRGSMGADIKEGLRFVLGHPVLRLLVGCMCTVGLFNAMVSAVEVVFLVRDRGISAATLGLIFSLGAVGGILGGLSSGWLTRRIGSARVVLLFLVLNGWFYGLFVLADNDWRLIFAIIGSFVTTFGGVVFNTAQVAYRQSICPPELLGRMTATIRFGIRGVVPIGSIAGGALGTWLGNAPAILIGAAGAILGGAWLVFSPVGRMRDFPAETPAGQLVH